jgi:subtilisin family serine protease
MRALARSLMATLALLLSFAVAGVARSQPAPIPAVAHERQLLVMLRLEPQHFRPESSYGGSYGDGAGRSVRWREAARVARDQGAVLVDEWPMPSLGVDCFVMAVPEGRPFEEVAARIAHDPSVSWTEPMHTYHGQGEPAAHNDPPSHNDPLYRVQPAAHEWRLAELHRISTGRNVRVAVIDSMVDKAHPDLAGQVEVVQNFVSDRPATPEAHGTGVAGIIAARADNGVGIAGIAPQARLMGLRACWEEKSATVCDTLSLAKALDFAIARKAQVINMSLSGPQDLLLGRLLDVALSHDIAVVAAYDRNAPGGGFPASHHGVTAVVDEGGGPSVPGVVAAPGRDVPTTEPGGRWFLVNGSSYAAAHVSGLLALVRQRGPFLHGEPMLVMARYNDMIDACATLLQKSGSCSCNCAHPNEISSIAAK